MPYPQTRIPDEEQQLLNNILDYAQYRRVLAMHPRPAKTEQGWRTAIQGDKGYFDLTLLGDGGVIFAELKRRKGAVHTDEQKAWEARARQAARHFDTSRFVVALWTFDNWPGDIRAAIDVIAKPAPEGEWVQVPDTVPAARIDVAAPVLASATDQVSVQVFIDGQPFDGRTRLARRPGDDAPGMRMAADVRDRILRMRRERA